MNGNMTTIVDMGQTGKNPSKMISYTFAPLIFYWILLTLLVCTFNMDISESNSFSVDLNISTFNCHGLKSSMGYMTELVKKHHITFVCEHWLLPSDIYTVSDTFKGMGKSAYLRSSVDPLNTLHGRPYGGIGFVCDSFCGYSYKFEEYSCDRVCGLLVYKNKKLVVTIIGVYLPHDDQTVSSMECYMETLDKIQSVLDSKNNSAPVLIVGDMNTRLPQGKTLRKDWFRLRPFSKRSGLLYEFLGENELFVGNFAYKQAVDYTFKRNDLCSYIDHVFIPAYLLENLKECVILNESADNVSDHFAISVVLHLQVKTHDDTSYVEYPSIPSYPTGSWNDIEFQQRYCAKISEELKKLKLVNLDMVNVTNAKDKINSLCNDLCSIMHHCVKECSSKSNSSTVTQKFPKKYWWNKECSVTKSRNRLFHLIWKECGRPSKGTIHECYKVSKKNFRKACRKAIQAQAKSSYRNIEKLCRARNSRQMWNIIKRTKPRIGDSDNISLAEFSDYYCDKFSASSFESPITGKAESIINEKYKNLTNEKITTYNEFRFSQYHVDRYIKRLKSGTSPGLDGVTSEHLKYALGSGLSVHLSLLFTMCFRHGVVPNTFSNGLLIPILKKSNLDPTDAKNYRPITVSVILSKIMEYFILENCVDHQYNDFQFGFVPSRSTAMATSIAHDVGEFCNAEGSPVFFCSLDAEGAFDAIPFSVLFNCASEAFPDICWRIMFYWYSSMNIRVRWQNQLSPPITVNRGTRQGGLTSPLLFNIFYQELIDKLQSLKSGIIINGRTHNVFAYADDILLASMTVSGLKDLIDVAVSHISERGLKFNPHKTICMNYGNNPFLLSPQWFIDGVSLDVRHELKYLGTVLSKSNGKHHVESRISAANKSYYGLQGAGLCKDGLSPQISAYIYNTTVRNSLTFGCDSIFITKGNLATLDKLQGKHLKAMLGLSFNCHTTPLLQALGIDPCSVSISLSALDLLRSSLSSSAATSNFYGYLLKCKNPKIKNTLIGRCRAICENFNIQMYKYILNSEYAVTVKKTCSYNILSGVNGIVDTVRTLLTDYDIYNHAILQNLLFAF